MKWKIVLAMAYALATAPAAWAQQQGDGDQATRYDQSTVTTIRGEVVETGSTGLFGIGGNEQVKVRTDKETLPVVLGPRNYLDTQNVKVEKGDQVTMTGSRVMIDNAPTILAREVRKNGDVLTLRAEDGTPAWEQPMGTMTPGQEQGGSQEQVGTGQPSGQDEQGGAASGQQGTGGGTGTMEGGRQGEMKDGCPTPMASPMTTPETTPMATPTMGMGQEQ